MVWMMVGSGLLGCLGIGRILVERRISLIESMVLAIISAALLAGALISLFLEGDILVGGAFIFLLWLTLSEFKF